jgi:subtilisin-like proprotein convertase family protein
VTGFRAVCDDDTGEEAMRRSVWFFAPVLAATSVWLAVPALAGADAFSFQNTGTITINDSSCIFGEAPSPVAATPYPSSISVSGLTGTITDVNVTLTGLTHTSSTDVGVLLVGPGGQKTLLMQDVGGTGVSGVNLTFDDAAAAFLPEIQIVSGTFKPTVGPADSCTPPSFPAPAPPGPYGSPSLSVFNGTNPNGTWSLYVIDDLAADTGSIAGGWSLVITAGETPEEMITDLQSQVSGLGLPKGLTTALNSKLQEALDALDADNTAGACVSLRAFLNQVASAQKTKKLTAEQAQPLTTAANDIRTTLDC